MNHNTRLILIFQSILIVLLAGSLLWIKRTAIRSRLHGIFRRDVSLTGDQNKFQGNIASPAFIDTSNNRPGEPFRILVIGNSLTYSAKAESYGWDHSGGMAASSMQKDFAHLLFQMTGDLLPGRNISMRIVRLVEFERNFATFDFSSTDTLVAYHPDIVIFQLGENVSFNKTGTPDLFAGRYIEFINRFKKDNNPLIICTTPFFPSNEKNEIMKKAAMATNSYLADLSHLVLLDEENYAKYERNYPGGKNNWKEPGIGIHPGDHGMENIARQIFIIINAAAAKMNTKSNP